MGQEGCECYVIKFKHLLRITTCIYMQIHSFMQISSVRRERFFLSLELVQSLKKRNEAVPGDLQAGPAPGCWAGSRKTTAELALLTETDQQRPHKEGRRALEISRMLTPPSRPSSSRSLRKLVRKRPRSDRLLPQGRDKRVPKWRPVGTGVFLSSVRNGQWTRPNGAGTWALTCGSG